MQTFATGSAYSPSHGQVSALLSVMHNTFRQSCGTCLRHTGTESLLQALSAESAARADPSYTQAREPFAVSTITAAPVSMKRNNKVAAGLGEAA